MKRYLSIFLFAIFISFTAFSQSDNKTSNKEWIYVVVTSPDKAIVNDLPEIRSLMNQELNKTKKYRVRLTFPDGTDALSVARADELSANLTSRDFNPDEIVEFGKLAGAKLLCVVQINKINAKTYKFFVDIFETEKGELVSNEFYPNAAYKKDTPVTDIYNTGAIQRAFRYMIARMDLGGLTYDAAGEPFERQKREANGTALAWSIIPGVGLMQKGHTGEGVAYLLGDVALIGGGAGMLTYANKQKNIMNDRNTTPEQYKAAKNNYNTARTVSYGCFGAAAALYIVNLIRSYTVQPKPGAKIQWYVASDFNTNQFLGRNASINLMLTYTF